MRVVGRTAGRLAALVLVAASASVRAADDRHDSAAAAASPRLGLNESTGITLTALDVDARDPQGRPMRGLTRTDFHVTLDGRDWPVYSVDDLCSCATSGDAGAISGDDAADVPRVDPVSYVFFLDFGELQQSGRARAFQEVRRWIRDVKQPGDEVLIAGYTQRAGLVEISPLSSDPARLLEGLNAAVEDPRLMDSFATQISQRVAQCTGNWSLSSSASAGRYDLDQKISCDADLYDEYSHGRDSLLGFKELLASLESIPGRKAVFHFQENMALHPSGLYYRDPIATSSPVGDQERLVSEVAVEANLSRAVIHGAYIGDSLGGAIGPRPTISDEALGTASLLADYTGGTYARDLNGVAELTTSVRRNCACTYRISLEAPAVVTSHVYDARVEIRGRPLPSGYRIAFLDAPRLKLRQAVAAMRNPERSGGFPIVAALVPVSATAKGGWNLRVQLAFDLDVLSTVLEHEGRSGSWEAGALLSNDDGYERWELLGASGVRRSEHTASPEEAASRRAEEARTPSVRSEPIVVHEHLFEGLPFGHYTVRAFVRDRTSLVLGGARTSVDLPKPSRNGLAGPVLFRRGRRQIVAALPPFTKEKIAETRVTELRTGSVPAPATVNPGEPLEAVTWICGAHGKVTSASIAQALARGSQPVPGMPRPVIEKAGECSRVVAAIDAALLVPGDYTYQVSWTREAGSRPAIATAVFHVGTPATAAQPAPKSAAMGEGAAQATVAMDATVASAP